jgi:hypothetical protein
MSARGLTRLTPGGLAGVALAATFALAPPAAAQSADALAKAQARFAKEPAVAEVVDVALKYFRVHPEVLDSLRSKAKTRALLPLIAAGYRRDTEAFDRTEVQTPVPVNITEATGTGKHALSVGAVWDFRELVFNPAEVQVFGLIGVQRDIMLEATRTYYLRKQLVLRKLYKPPEDPMAAAALDMRIDEFTALLDVITGGWFSQQANP